MRTTLKVAAFFAVNLLAVLLSAQTTTYSPFEEKMLRYANNQDAYAWKHDSLSNLVGVLDSCKNFLMVYPNSFAKPGVLSYMLKMTLALTKDTTRIFPLIDSVLRYDQIAVTKYGIADMLIENGVARERAQHLLSEAYPALTNTHHKYRANILFARLALSDGFVQSARNYYEQAMKEEPTRIEGWIEYGSCLKLGEDSHARERIIHIIDTLESNEQKRYEAYTEMSPNISNNISEITVPDLNHIPIAFKQFLGKPFILQNFSFWCGVPTIEMPTLAKMSKEFPEVKVVFVNCGDTREELTNRYLRMPKYSFLKKNIIVFDEAPFPFKRLVALTTSTFFLIDRNGAIRAEYHGYNKRTKAILRQHLKALTREK